MGVGSMVVGIGVDIFLNIKPSLTGYISKGIAFCGKGDIPERGQHLMLHQCTWTKIHKPFIFCSDQAIALFSADQYDESNLLLKELTAGCPNADTCACRIVQVYEDLVVLGSEIFVVHCTPETVPGFLLARKVDQALESHKSMMTILRNNKGQLPRLVYCKSSLISPEAIILTPPHLEFQKQ
ncbi:hypothetical protein BDR07DRAFT_1464382, partial [Suillus spraguei]